MAINPLKALLFLGGGIVAALAVAWFAGGLDSLSPSEPPAVANAPQPAAPKGDRPVASGPGGTAQEQTGEPAAAPEVIPPAFDIVRVAPDGSIVIAGRAAPDAMVDILIGSRIIGKAEAGGGGDFAAVVDEPLKPGDYQIVLRSTSPDNVVAASPETAIVSIPEQKDGQVLALVEQPGQPSRLITVPEPEPAAPQASAPEPEATAPEPEAPASADSDTAQPPAASGEEQAAAESPADATQDKPATDAAPGAAETAQEAPAGGQEPSAPAAGEPEQETAAAPRSDEPAASVAPEPAEQPAHALEPEQAAPAPAEERRVAVEAVEIEGRKIFVAGVAQPGSVLRAYANDILLGETQTSAAGRFLIETERDLPVGDYIIRADMVARDGSVIARAAVPFEREEGEAIAAIAPPPAPTTSEPAPATGEADPAAGEAAPADDSAPADRTAPAAQRGTESAAAEPDARESRPGEAPAEAPQAAGQAPSAPAESGRASTETPTPPQGRESVAAAEPRPEPQAGRPAAEAEAAPEGSLELPALGTGIAAGPPTVTAPKLQAVDSAVIIRRGDNLWRISRRVYGRGVRYTTIYLANQDQISNPHRIWPGQVFAVPDRTPEGEAADLEPLGDRLTTLPRQ